MVPARDGDPSTVVYMSSYADRSERRSSSTRTCSTGWTATSAAQRTTKTAVIAAAVEAWLDEHEAAPEFPFVGIGRSGHGRLSLDGRLDRPARGRPPTRRPVAIAEWRSCSTRRRSSPRPTPPTSTTARRSPGSRASTSRCCSARSGSRELDLLLQRELGRRRDAGRPRVAGRGRDPARRRRRREDLARAADLMAEAAEHRPRLADARASPDTRRSTPSPACGATPGSASTGGSKSKALWERKTLSRIRASTPKSPDQPE